MLLRVWPDGRLQCADNSYRCALGRGGVVKAKDKREGDGATPAGSWALRRLFFRADRMPIPCSGLSPLSLWPGAGWCDDPGVPAHYNRLVALPFAGSHERLWRDDHLYDLIVTLGYNDHPPVPGLGSAIFIHVAHQDYTPTEGCIALALADLRAVLRRITTDTQLEIHSAGC